MCLKAEDGKRNILMRNRPIFLFVLFLSLSIVGSFIKIPAGIGSLALDSMPALVAAAIVSPLWGMAVAALGHLMSAGLAGFPIGPLHLLVAVQMAVLVFLFGFLYRKHKPIVAIGLFVIGNGLIAPLMFWKMLGIGFVLVILPGIFVASILNVFTAGLLIPRLKTVWEKKHAKAGI